jgi:hypothetical protein
MQRWYVAILTLLLSFSQGCSSDSAEAQVRHTLDVMERAAEDRDVGDLMEHVSAEYRDAYGQGKQEVAPYVRGYFIANQSIHLLTRIEKLEFPLPDEAHVTVQVGMVGRDAEASSAWNLAVDLYEFQVTLRREGDEWQVRYAQWRRK